MISPKEFWAATNGLGLSITLINSRIFMARSWPCQIAKEEAGGPWRVAKGAANDEVMIGGDRKPLLRYEL